MLQISAVGRTSRVPNPVINRNADLMDESGRHELASVDYPLVGMQSELDPDYLEYQILSAKAANIDGFFVEWGFVEHGSERIRQALTLIAARYDFEIGINLCDRWLFTQLPSRRPELKSREQLVEAFITNYQELLRILGTTPTTVRFKGRPVVFLFGDGLSPQEFDRLHEAVAATAGTDPCVLIRPRLAARVDASGALAQSWNVAPWFEPTRGFHRGVAGFFGWVPTRARTDGSGDFLRQFDRYGTIADSLDYLKLIMAVSILKAGGLGTGGFNFDAKLRRPSIDAEDLFHAHIGGMDTYALAFKLARKILVEGKFEQFVAARYASYDSDFGRAIELRRTNFRELEKLVLGRLGEPKPRSGKQEYLENLLLRYLESPGH